MIETLQDIVRALATDAGRMVGTSGHDDARRYLLEQIRSRELSGYHDLGHELEYSHSGAEFTNVLAVLPGARPDFDPVLLAAHYDTCGPLPGADDNAAAIAILLSMVEPLRAAGLERSVIFAFFDAEEPPYYLSEAMGSTWFYDHQRRETIHCALVLDLVGHDVAIPSWEDVLFVTGMESDPALLPIFESAAASTSAIRTLPTLTRYIGDMSDYRPFRLDRRPYLFFSCAQWQHYHMATDTPDKLNYTKMAAISDYLVRVTIAAAASAFRGPFEGYDTTPTEIKWFQSIGGPLLEEFGVELRSRADLDHLVAQLVSVLLHG